MKRWMLVLAFGLAVTTYVNPAELAAQCAACRYTSVPYCGEGSVGGTSCFIYGTWPNMWCEEVGSCWEPCEEQCDLSTASEDGVLEVAIVPCTGMVLAVRPRDGALPGRTILAFTSPERGPVSTRLAVAEREVFHAPTLLAPWSDSSAQ